MLDVHDFRTSMHDGYIYVGEGATGPSFEKAGE